MPAKRILTEFLEARDFSPERDGETQLFLLALNPTTNELVRVQSEMFTGDTSAPTPTAAQFEAGEIDAIIWALGHAAPLSVTMSEMVEQAKVKANRLRERVYGSN